jgi:hypothetical protein
MKKLLRVGCLVAAIMLLASMPIMAGSFSDGADYPSNPNDPVGLIIFPRPTSPPIVAFPPYPIGKVITILYQSAGPPPFTFSGSGNRDPYINYHLEFTNTTASDAFVEVAFGIPIVPQGDNSALISDLDVTLIDGGDNLVSLTPTYDGINASTGIQRALLSTDGAATFLTADEFGPLGPSITAAGASDYHFYQPTSPLPPTKSFNYMELLVGFNLSAGDTVILDGDIIIRAPEPSSLSLLGIGAIGMLYVRKRARPAYQVV